MIIIIYYWIKEHFAITNDISVKLSPDKRKIVCLKGVWNNSSFGKKIIDITCDNDNNIYEWKLKRFAPESITQYPGCIIVGISAIASTDKYANKNFTSCGEPYYAFNGYDGEIYTRNGRAYPTNASILKCTGRDTIDIIVDDFFVFRRSCN